MNGKRWPPVDASISTDTNVRKRFPSGVMTSSTVVTADGLALITHHQPLLILYADGPESSAFPCGCIPDFFFSRRGRFLLLCRSQVDLEGNSSWNQRKWRLSGRNWRSNWNFETWKLDKCSDDDLKCRRCYQRRPHSHPVWFQQRKTHKRRRKKRELCICR